MKDGGSLPRSLFCSFEEITINFYIWINNNSKVEFYNSLWGLGTEKEYGCRTEHVFLNVYEDQESIPRNEFRQPM
jgi:hypothetical protein